MRILTILFLFTLFLSEIHAQTLPEISAKVLTLGDVELPQAHVINLTRQFGTTTNDTGFFRIGAKAGDSLLITYVGFFPKIVVISNQQGDGIDSIYLMRQSTELEGISIVSMPVDFLSFKRAFSNLRLPADTLQTIHFEMMKMPASVQPGLTLKGPFQALYDAYSKEARQKRKLHQLMTIETIERIRERRINNHIIKMLTGLTDAESILRFSRFCHVPDHLVITSNDYDLYLWLLSCYNQYCKQYCE